MRSYNSIGIYDKEDNLVDYIEFKSLSDEMKCYYSVEGNSLSRKFVNEYYDDESPFEETVSSVIDFGVDFKLYSTISDGETVIRAMDMNHRISPEIESRVDTYQDNEIDETSIQCFTLKSDLINECLNKL